MSVNEPHELNGEIRVSLEKGKKGDFSFKLSFSRGIERYFRQNVFSFKYCEALNDIPAGILSIPVLANIAPVAWATAVAIRVKELDETFYQSLDKIKSALQCLFPSFPL